MKELFQILGLWITILAAFMCIYWVAGRKADAVLFRGTKGQPLKPEIKYIGQSSSDQNQITNGSILLESGDVLLLETGDELLLE